MPSSAHPRRSVVEQVETSLKATPATSTSRTTRSSAQPGTGPAPARTNWTTRVTALSYEVRQRLNQHRPQTLGRPSRLSGVTPAAISLLLIHLKKGHWKAISAAGRPDRRPRCRCPNTPTRATPGARGLEAARRDADRGSVASPARPPGAAHEVEPGLQPERGARSGGDAGAACAGQPGRRRAVAASCAGRTRKACARRRKRRRTARRGAPRSRCRSST